MRYNDTIGLITETTTYNMGIPTVSTSTTTVFANQMSVGKSEFYNAVATGLRPSAMFEIRSIDYNGASKLIHNGITYNIIRVETKGEFTRLICERVMADG